MIVVSVPVSSIKRSRIALALFLVGLIAVVGAMTGVLTIWLALFSCAIAGIAWWNFSTTGSLLRSRPAPPPEYVAPFHVAENADAASWIPPRLHGFALNVGSFVPDGYEAYARIFHPPLKHMPDGTIVEVQWKDIAAANGRTIDEELMLFGDTDDPTQFDAAGNELWNQQSHIGSFSRKIADRLISTLQAHTQTSERCWFAVWEGWGGLAERWPTAPRFSIPAREFLLFDGPITDAELTFAGVDWSYQSANFWWPDDRSWCVATEIDAKWTYVGGSRECIAQLLADSAFEAYPVTLTTIR